MAAAGLILGLTPGQTVHHYRLIEKIGEGGMGVVWRALDTTLDREVAIKVLPDVFAGDPDRLARLEREVKLLAALNHPNIAAVHGLDELNGRRFLIMELVPGEDLKQRLAGGPIPLEDALALFRQIAETLPIPDTEGATAPFFSPDGTWIAFVLGNVLARISLSGGAPQSVTGLPPVSRGANWPTDDAIYLSPTKATGVMPPSP